MKSFNTTLRYAIAIITFLLILVAFGLTVALGFTNPKQKKDKAVEIEYWN